MSRRAVFAVVCGLFFPELTLGQGVSIDHQGVGCVLAGKFPRFDCRLDPADKVARARLNFRPEGSPHWYSVDMKPEAGLFQGILPKPKKTLHRFSYYIDVTDKAFQASRTAEFTPEVATGPAACGKEKFLAAGLSRATVLLHAPQGVAGVPSVPAGFAADGVVTAGGAGGTTGATGGGLGTKAVILGAAVAAGGAAAVIASAGGDDTTAPPPPTTTPGGPPASPPPASPPPAASLTGTWIGNRPADGMVLNFSGCGLCINTPTFSAGDIVLNLTDSAGALSGNGTFTIQEAPPAGCPEEPGCNQGSLGSVLPASITGSVNGTSVNMQLVITTPGEPMQALLTLNGIVSGNRMSGGAILTGPFTGGTANGTWAVNRQ